MLRRCVVRPAVALVPRHDLLIVARVGAEGIADAAGRGVEAGEVGGLAEAGPDLLGRGRGAAARLRGLVQEGAAGGA